MEECLGAARRFADDGDALLLEQGTQPVPEEIVVVDQEDANCVLTGVLDQCALGQRLGSLLSRA